LRTSTHTRSGSAPAVTMTGVAGIAVGERIADQVREHLLEAVAIPGAAQLGALQLNRRGGMRGSQLVHDRRERVAQIHRREDELQATPRSECG
jgi:xanthosine utilization system XapX-like protein